MENVGYLTLDQEQL